MKKQNQKIISHSESFTWPTGRWYGPRSWLAGTHWWSDWWGRGPAAHAGDSGRGMGRERWLSRVTLLALTTGGTWSADSRTETRLCSSGEVIYRARQILKYTNRIRESWRLGHFHIYQDSNQGCISHKTLLVNGLDAISHLEVSKWKDKMTAVLKQRTCRDSTKKKSVSQTEHTALMLSVCCQN